MTPLPESVAHAMHEMAVPDAGWQPIETAPKDGQILMLCVAGFRPAIGSWFTPPSNMEFEPCWVCDALDDGLFETDEQLREYLMGDYRPTHWMPLPETAALPGWSEIPAGLESVS